MSKKDKNPKKRLNPKAIQDARRVKTVKNMVENGGKVSTAMRKAGYSEAYSKNPQKFTKTKTWIDTLEEHLPDHLLMEHHGKLLMSHRLDHMVFPPLPKPKKEKKPSKSRRKSDEDLEDDDDDGAMDRILEAASQARSIANEEDVGAKLSDNDIKAMLNDVGCIVKRIVHGEMARHVYFWSPDNKAKKEALDMAYKLKSRYVEKVENTHSFTGYEELTDEQLNNEFTNFSKLAQGTKGPNTQPPQGEAAKNV